MEAGLRELLRETALEATGNFTHETLFGPRGRWSVRTESYAAFWTGYCSLVATGTPNLCLAERRDSTMPVIVECTLRFLEDPEEDEEPYDETFLVSLVAVYQDAIQELLAVSEEGVELVCCVLESKPWTEQTEGGNRLSARIRLQFPYCHCETNFQSSTLRPRALQLLHNRNLFSRLPRQPVDPWDAIVSAELLTKSVLLYGSSESSSVPPLSLTCIWGVIENIEESPPRLALQEYFYPANHDHVYRRYLSAETIESGGREATFWLPLFFSLSYFKQTTMPRETRSLTRPVSTPETSHLFGTGGREEREELPMEVAERFLQMIKSQRYWQREYWLDVGRALHNTDFGGEAGLSTWIQYTRRALREGKTPSRDLAEVCSEHYGTLAGCAVTIKTLAWYAREDSPTRYAEWHRSWCLAAMERAVASCTHTDVAVALYRTYWLEYVCCSMNSGWYRYVKDRWVESDKGVDLSRNISADFVRRFEQIRLDLDRSIHESQDETFRAMGEISMKKIGTLIVKLKTAPFKSSLMSEARELFYSERFCQLRDGNSDLTGMLGCVLEVVEDRVVARPGKPEDFVTRCTGVLYRHDLNWEHPLVAECMSWLEQVFTDRLLLSHFLKFSASCLKSGNFDKIFPIFTGGGDNSKSMVVKLFECTFGPQYCVKFPVSLLTGRRTQSSGATPELARASAAKIAVIQEPDDDEDLNKALIKGLISTDSFFARLLFSNGGDVKATFKMILMCNAVPTIPRADKAVKNRIRLFPFLSTWVDDPPEEERERFRARLFKKDPQFERRIPFLASAFMWILVQYYPRYAEEGLLDPPLIREVTDEYWRDTDLFFSFAEECIDRATNEDGSPDLSASLSLGDVYNAFREWYRDAYPNGRVPTRPIVKKELVARWGPLSSNSWFAVRLKNEGAYDMTAAITGKAKRSVQA